MVTINNQGEVTSSFREYIKEHKDSFKGWKRSIRKLKQEHKLEEFHQRQILRETITENTERIEHEKAMFEKHKNKSIDQLRDDYDKVCKELREFNKKHNKQKEVIDNDSKDNQLFQ